jgi:5,10-methenyltetrahydrofolate synthetase
LRAQLLEARLQQPASAARETSLAARLLSVLRERAPSCVGFYWPARGEFDARGVLADWLAEGADRSAALPVVITPAAPLAFHRWRPGMQMKTGRFGIAVPDHGDGDGDAVDIIPDLLLVPCVGFDPTRLRLGYGGGYYDRTLAGLAARAARPMAIGVGYDSGLVAALPREAHDMPLDAIVSESRCY